MFEKYSFKDLLKDIKHFQHSYKLRLFQL